MALATDLQFDGRLTNVAIQYNNTDLIADMVLPPTPVPHKKFTYKQYDKDERFTVPSTKVGESSEPNEVDWNITEVTDSVKDFGLKKYISNDAIDNAEVPITPMTATTNFVTGLMQLDKEIRAAGVVFTAANYAAANQLDVAGAWTTLSTDALSQIEAGIDACFMPPNVMVMGIATWRKLSRNTTILAAMKGTLAPQQVKSAGGLSQPAVNVEEMATYLGLDAVLIGKVRNNSANKGQTASFARVWDGTNAGKGGAALLRVMKGSALDEVVWGANFAWKGRQTFTNDSTRGIRGGKEVRVVESYIHKPIASDVGYLFKDCLVT